MKFYEKWIMMWLLKTKGVTKMFEKIRLMLAGKKAYLTAAGMILLAIVEFTNTGDVSVLVNRIIEAIAVITVRAAISK